MFKTEKREEKMVGEGGAAVSLPHTLPAWDTGVRLEEAGFRVFF